MSSLSLVLGCLSLLCGLLWSELLKASSLGSRLDGSGSTHLLFMAVGPWRPGEHLRWVGSQRRSASVLLWASSDVDLVFVVDFLGTSHDELTTPGASVHRLFFELTTACIDAAIHIGIHVVLSLEVTLVLASV